MSEIKKLTFEVSNYDLVEMAESEIMKVKMKIVSEGNNAHDMPIKWETILKAKDTLVGKPIVAKYDRWNKDLMGHEEDEIPVGVVLRSEDIFEDTDENGKRWLCAYGDIWMRYTQDITGVLIRDMMKHLSMEILVAEQDEISNEILAFAFTGITLIGEDRSPAVDNAKLEVLTFEAVKDNIEKLMFAKYENIDFKIPKKVQENAQKGLELRKEYGRGGTEVGVATARQLAKGGNATPELIKKIYKFFPRHLDNIKKSLNTKTEVENSEIAGYLWGSLEGMYWANRIYKRMLKEDGEKMEKANDFEKEVDVKEESKEVEMACGEKMSEEEVKEESMACGDKMEKMEEDKSEEPKEEKMTSDAYAENSAIEQNQEKVGEEQREQAEEQNKPEPMDSEKMEIDKAKYEEYVQMEKDFAEMKENFAKMSEEMKAMKEDKDAYMTEFERLQKVENEIKEARFNAEVEATFAEIEDMPLDEINSFKESAKNFTLENLNTWKNEVLAKAYTYSKGKKSSSKYVKVDIPKDVKEEKKSNGLWD